ncbi:hypothetical protein HDV02_003948 [Globomyces sp. JEL0801]|nr:hypothetical protein HDV02_003948 [Globomyces sp. JEL0801]
MLGTNRNVQLVSPQRVNKELLANAQGPDDIFRSIPDGIELMSKTQFDNELSKLGSPTGVLGFATFGEQKNGKSTLINHLLEVNFNVGHDQQERTTKGAVMELCKPPKAILKELKMDSAVLLVIDLEGSSSIDKMTEIEQAFEKSPYYKTLTDDEKENQLEVMKGRLKIYEKKLSSFTLSIVSFFLPVVAAIHSGLTAIPEELKKILKELQISEFSNLEIKVVLNKVGETEMESKEYGQSILRYWNKSFKEIAKTISSFKMPHFQKDDYERATTEAKENYQSKIKELRSKIFASVNRDLVIDPEAFYARAKTLVDTLNDENRVPINLLDISSGIFRERLTNVLDTILNTMKHNLNENSIITQKEIESRVDNARAKLNELMVPESIKNDGFVKINDANATFLKYLKCNGKCSAGHDCKFNQANPQHEHGCYVTSLEKCDACGFKSGITSCNKPFNCGCCGIRCPQHPSYVCFQEKGHKGEHCQTTVTLKCINARKGCTLTKDGTCGDSYHCGCCRTTCEIQGHGGKQCISKSKDHKQHFCTECCPSTGCINKAHGRSERCVLKVNGHTKHRCKKCCNGDCGCGKPCLNDSNHEGECSCRTEKFWCCPTHGKSHTYVCKTGFTPYCHEICKLCVLPYRCSICNSPCSYQLHHKSGANKSCFCGNKSCIKKRMAQLIDQFNPQKSPAELLSYLEAEPMNHRYAVITYSDEVFGGEHHQFTAETLQIVSSMRKNGRTTHMLFQSISDNRSSLMNTADDYKHYDDGNAEKLYQFMKKHALGSYCKLVVDRHVGLKKAFSPGFRYSFKYLDKSDIYVFDHI